VPFWRPPRRCPGFDPPLGIGYFFNPTFDFPNETPKNLGYFLPLSSATFAIARISLRSSLVKSFGHFTSRTPLSVQQPSAQENLRVFSCANCAAHPRQPGREYSLIRPGQVALAEAGRPASHFKSSRLSPSGPNAGLLCLR